MRMRGCGVRRCANAAVLVFEAFVLSMQVANTPWRFSGSDVDSSVFRYVALVMQRGGMPYLDTFDHKGPLVYLVNYLGMRISYWRGLWIFEFLAILLLCLFLYRLARVFLDRVPSHLVVFATASLLPLYLEGGNLVEEWALPFIAFSTWAFFEFVRTRVINHVMIAGCGLSLAAVLMLRPNMIAIWVLYVPYVLRYLIVEKRSELGWCVLAFVAGVLVVMVPTLCWLASNTALTAFVDDYLVFSFAYSAGHSTGALQNMLDKANVAWHFFNNPIIILCIIVALLPTKNRTRSGIFGVAYLALSIATVAMSGYKFNHYGMVLLPAVAACMSAGMCDMYLARGVGLDHLSWRPIVAVVFVCLLVPAVVPSWLTCVDNAILQYGQRAQSHVIGGEQGEAVRVVQECTQPEDRITVCGNTDVIYLASGRMSSSYYSYQTPIASFNHDIFPAYLDDLRTSEPTAIILPDAYQYKDEMMEFITENGYRRAGETSRHWATIWAKE